MAFAIVGYFIIPREPSTTSFLTERERLIAVERIRIENAGLVSQQAWIIDRVS